MNRFFRSLVRVFLALLLSLACFAPNTAKGEFPTVWVLKRDGSGAQEAAVSLTVGTFITNVCTFMAGTFGSSATIAGTGLVNTSGHTNVFVAC